jgi:hypothetical protein
LKSEFETAVSEIFNAFINVVHTHTDTSFSFKFENLHFFFFTLSISEDYLESSWFINDKISGSVLITESMSSNNNWFFPSWNKPWNIFDDDWFSEYCTVKNVSDSSIWAFPHLFKFEFFNSCLIRSDGGTFDSYFTLLDGIGSIDGNLIVSGISMFHTKIEIFDVKI